MKDPYKVLNVPRTATDDEIKKAYRELARKYHPDNYAGNPLADLVQEKMKEVNEAYDQIQRERASGSRGGASSAGSGTNSGFVHIRSMINMGRYSEAELMIDAVAQSDRNAEWNYLKGVVLIKRGWYIDAQKYLEAACYMDPDNAEYKNALNNLRNTAASYGGGYRSSSGSVSPCDICMNLICADCLCECCGGDLIPCC
ncbi:MAG: J domain-containing protein [Clostridia bacterium]|nr:J domain-containing protein [Clostridia bacterium]